MKKQVSVVVVTKNRPQALAALLGSLQCQTLPEFDLIIVLNGRRSWHPYLDKLLKALESRGVHTAMYSMFDLAFAGLHDYAYSKTTSEYVCRVDDDHILHPAYLSELKAFMDRSPQAGAAGGIVLHPDVPGFEFSREDFVKTILQARERGILNTLLQLKRHPTNRPLEVPDLYSSFMARRRTVLSVGGIAVCYRVCSYREETDLTLRMSFAGHGQFIVPGAIIWHARADYGGERKSQEVWKRLRSKNESLFQKRLQSWCTDPVEHFLPLWNWALVAERSK